MDRNRAVLDRGECRPGSQGWCGGDRRRPSRLVRRGARIVKRFALVALLLIANPACAITVREYAASLDRLRALMASKQIQQAHVEATALMGSEVDGGFHVDDTLLRAVIEATTPDIKLISRLAATAVQLRAASSGTLSTADQKLLRELEDQQSAGA